MKQLLILLAAIITATTAVAQKPMATVSHNGNLTFFESDTAFADAYNQAENGDTIFLSAGYFIHNSEDITITKRISIVGCGYDSFIVPNITFYMRNNPDSYMEAPLFDGVRIKQLIFSNDYESRVNLYSSTIANSYIGEILNAGYGGNEVLIDRCHIDYADFDGNGNVCIQNSKLGQLGSNTQYISAINCNIGMTTLSPRILRSSIIMHGNPYYAGVNGRIEYSGIHVIENSLFPSTDIFLNNSSSIGNQFQLVNCYFDDNDGEPLLDDNLECTIDLAAKGYIGEDGTVIGVYGGYTPYTETPTVPTVDAAKSSVQYDKENNKLNVTITVAPN